MILKVQQGRWPKFVFAQCSRPLLLDDYRGLYYPIGDCHNPLWEILFTNTQGPCWLTFLKSWDWNRNKKETRLSATSTASILPANCLAYLSFTWSFLHFFYQRPQVDGGNIWNHMETSKFVTCSRPSSHGIADAPGAPWAEGRHPMGILFRNFCRNDISAQESPISHISAENRNNCRQFSILPKWGFHGLCIFVTNAESG